MRNMSIKRLNREYELLEKDPSPMFKAQPLKVIILIIC